MMKRSTYRTGKKHTSTTVLKRRSEGNLHLVCYLSLHRLEVFDRAILCLPTCFFFMQKVSHAYWSTMVEGILIDESRWATCLLGLIICYLMMTVLSSLPHRPRVRVDWMKSYNSMAHVLDSALTERKVISTLTPIHRNQWGIFVEAFSERYLGLSTVIGPISSSTFDHIGERVRSKVQGWSEKLFACAGHEILLKLVVQAIPTYSMSTFLLTKKNCKSITSPMAKYIWGSSLDKKAMHWFYPLQSAMEAMRKKEVQWRHGIQRSTLQSRPPREARMATNDDT